MADQSDSNTQTPVYPVNPSPDQGIPSTSEVSPVPSTEIPVYEPPATIPIEELPTVAVSNQGSSIPKWFYFLFAIVLIIFFIVTALLVVNDTQKKSILQLFENVQVTPTMLPNVTSPTPIVTQKVLPSIYPTLPAALSNDLKLPQLSATDETSDLEKDINSTDFTQLEKAISNLDGEVGKLGVTP